MEKQSFSSSPMAARQSSTPQDNIDQVTELESESPTQPLHNFNEALLEEKASKDENKKENDLNQEEPYVVKATPMSDKHSVSTEEAAEASPTSDDNSMQTDTEAEAASETLSDNTHSFNVTETQETPGKAIESLNDETEEAAGSLPPSEPSSEAKENKTGPEIPSFSEWTQKALEEEQKKREVERRKREEEKEKKKKNLQTTSNQNGGSPASGSTEGAKENSTRLAVPEPHVTNANHHTARLKKNFASLDCGAKVAAANSEAQSALNIITPSR